MSSSVLTVTRVTDPSSDIRTSTVADAVPLPVHRCPGTHGAILSTSSSYVLLKSHCPVTIVPHDGQDEERDDNDS